MQLQAISSVAIKKAAAPINNSKNQIVMNELKNELLKSMDETKAQKTIGDVLDICKKANIEPENLPINEKFPGNLTKDERFKFLDLFYDKLFKRN